MKKKKRGKKRSSDVSVSFFFVFVLVSIKKEENKKQQKNTHFWTLLDLFLFLRPKVLSSMIWVERAAGVERGIETKKGE